MRRVGAIIAAAVLAMACGSAGQSTAASAAASARTGAAGTVTVTFLVHWMPTQVATANKYIAKFEQANPGIKVQIRAVPFANLLSTLRAQASSPSGPTIAHIYDVWLPELVNDGIVAKAPAAQLQDIRSNYPAGLVSGAVTVDNAIYGYPSQINLYMLNYNKKLFADAGISGPPATWADLIADAQKLTERDSSGNMTQQGFGLINSWDSGVVHPWLSLVLSDGGQLLNGTTPQLTSQAAEDTTALYNQLVNELKVTSPAMGTSNASTTGPYLDNFANQRTAMIIMANWWASSLKSAMGANYDNIGTAPIPVGPHGTASRSVSYAWLSVVNAHASPEQQAAAWKFLQWWDNPGSGDTPGSSAIGSLMISMGNIPSRNSDVQAFQSQLETPFLKPYIDGLSSAVPFPIVLGGAELTVAIQKTIESVEFGQATPQAAMQSAQSQAQQILGQYYK